MIVLRSDIKLIACLQAAVPLGSTPARIDKVAGGVGCVLLTKSRGSMCITRTSFLSAFSQKATKLRVSAGRGYSQFYLQANASAADLSETGFFDAWGLG